MRKQLIVLTCSSLFFIGLCLIASAQSPTVSGKPDTDFRLADGDRVVFLGNSLIEDDVQFGYLEMALTTRWPGRTITFRNLGWSGDNVFGEARSYVTTPPTPYELLIQQLADAKPTVVFLAYGGVEAQDGEAGLSRFKQGLNQLIDKIDQLGAQTILVSPIPVLLPSSANVTQRNTALERYASTVAQTASERKKRYVDVFKPIQDASKQMLITDDGIHLNETGYYYLAKAFENGLALPPRTSSMTIDLAKQAVESATPIKLLNTDKSTASVTFIANEALLPLPAPKQDDKALDVDNGQMLTIKGLKKGFYTLRVDNDEVMTASAKQWADGILIRQGPSFTRSAELQALIQKKNKLHFFQYRPLNQTYIIGFRSYEQGRHKKGLEEQNYLITWLEGEIMATNQPKPATYSLTQLK
ncbi:MULTISPECIES: GDSL-type esterase/lipase family protein [unclassified Spirosoma]|uniref:GDSL-type esterase/lipase family protein n=1 Tax=unclassified Spirosoma TaxID=2621999 RepID=UPI00095F0DAE|nr:MULTISPECIES: GDSL-type esterase/lipase family protein [unclassified Spirosoma]MBN8824914.1 GDSL family lipase [Spirosoma sp.]OJW74765.1 MAG: GDSL family lipase [Spirosoma sp. 48-14]